MTRPAKRPWQNRGVAVTLAVLGIAVAFAPAHVPELTLPDSPQAHEATMPTERPAMDDETNALP
jgi:hypothetical protein